MKWRIKGFKGQHDEDGATIVNEFDSIVASSYGGLYEGAPQSMWNDYHRTARLVEKAPELLAALIETKNALALIWGDRYYVNKAERLVDYVNKGSVLPPAVCPCGTSYDNHLPHLVEGLCF